LRLKLTEIAEKIDRLDLIGQEGRRTDGQMKKLGFLENDRSRFGKFAAEAARISISGQAHGHHILC
jgi:hypothetical protein